MTTSITLLGLTAFVRVFVFKVQKLLSPDVLSTVVTAYADDPIRCQMHRPQSKCRVVLGLAQLKAISLIEKLEI